MAKRLSRSTAQCIGSLLIAASLLVPFSAFADGLPGEYLITNRWRTLLAAYSPLSNPALLTEANYIGLRLAASQTLGEFTMVELGTTVPIGLYQSAGLTWLSEGTSPFPATAVDPVTGAVTVQPNNISDNTNFFMLSYAINPWKRFSLGVNVNIAQRSLFGTSQTAFGADVGITYRILRNPVLGDHVIGVSALNLLAPTFGTESYSRSLQIQWLSNYWEKRFETSFDFNVKDWLAQAGEFLQSTDALPEWDMNARFGGWLLRMINIYGLLGFSSQNGYEYWGFAGGFNVPTVNMGRDLAIAYQFLKIREGEAFTNSIYIRTDIGKHREEVYARKMARLANITPNNLYTRALALYNEGNFWDAFFLFGRLRVEFPDFYKNDWVSYYMASCQEQLDMRPMATAGYEKTNNDYPRSVAVPFADLGLMRLHFREADYSGVASQFIEMNKPEVPDSLKYHACYLMGEAYFAQGDPAKAKQTLDLIPETHPEYLFAQHTIGIINYTNGQIDASLLSFQNCVQATPTTDAQKEIVNRSFVFLGYIFYENANQIENSFAKAVTAMRSVPATSYYYEDAQLGLGWVGLRASQMQDCISAGDNLLKSSKKATLQAEGGLLKAYAYMMQRDYAVAVATLEDALKRLEGYVPVSQDSLQREQLHFAGVRSGYDGLADAANQLALTRQSSLVLSQIDSLGSPQKSGFKQINEHYSFVDNVHRAKLFERNSQQVSDDLNYALARAQKSSGLKGNTEVKQKTKEKTEQLDNEIDKLKKEMEQLNQGK